MVKAEIAIQQQKQNKYVCEGAGRPQSPAKTKKFRMLYIKDEIVIKQEAYA